MATSVKKQMWRKIKRNFNPGVLFRYMFDPNHILPVMFLLLLAEIAVCVVVINKIKCEYALEMKMRESQMNCQTGVLTRCQLVAAISLKSPYFDLDGNVC